MVSLRNAKLIYLDTSLVLLEIPIPAADATAVSPNGIKAILANDLNVLFH